MMSIFQKWWLLLFRKKRNNWVLHCISLVSQQAVIMKLLKSGVTVKKKIVVNEKNQKW